MRKLAPDRVTALVDVYALIIRSRSRTTHIEMAASLKMGDREAYVT